MMRAHRPRGGERRTGRADRTVTAPDLERVVAALESSLDPLFAGRRHREFFDHVHRVRESFRAARLDPATRERLWSRLNRLVEMAKARQAREFAERNAENLARWRDALTRAETYAAALDAEIAELAARRGPAAELARWQGRIAEKRERRMSVEATIAELQRKIAAVSARGA